MLSSKHHPVLEGLRLVATLSDLSASPLCFVDGTHVQTPYGFEEIQFLTVGDLVLARCEETGEISSRRITKCSTRDSESVLYVVTQSDIAGTDTVGTTAEHPFWVQGRGWVEARSLSAGNLLISSIGVRTIVLSVRDAQYRTAVFNIEVEALHTYFAGNHGVWVHNACRVASTSAPWQRVCLG